MVMQEVLDSSLRRTSGLESREGPAIEIPGRHDRRFEIFANKTEEELERWKRRRLSEGKGGKGNALKGGKGNGKEG